MLPVVLSSSEEYRIHASGCNIKLTEQRLAAQDQSEALDGEEFDFQVWILGLQRAVSGRCRADYWNEAFESRLDTAGFGPRCLNAGVMENGLVSPSVEGTPQGGSSLALAQQPCARLAGPGVGAPGTSPPWKTQIAKHERKAKTIRIATTPIDQSFLAGKLNAGSSACDLCCERTIWTVRIELSIENAGSHRAFRAAHDLPNIGHR